MTGLDLYLFFALNPLLAALAVAITAVIMAAKG